MNRTRKLRVDQLLVERGLAESREKAQALVMAGTVLINGQKADKPSRTLADDARLELVAKLPYVSRGGLKLAHALDVFQVPVAGRVCVDVGSSTGGFTDCLLQRGALRVYAIDTGTGQLDWGLRNDPRVIVREGRNARYLEPDDTGGETVQLAVADVSFISLTLVLPAVLPRVEPEGDLVVLVKPQFEVGRGEVGKGGIVRDPALHQAACQRVESALHSAGWRTVLTGSPILGAEGNREFLLHGRRA